MSAIRIEDRLSRAGDGVNEDRVGVSGDLAWAIDGATDVLGRSLTPGPTDAAWLAERLAAALDAAGPASPPLEQVLAHATAALAEAWEAERLAAPDGPQDLPSAAGALLRGAPGGRLDFLRLGDCRALLRPPGGRVQDLGATPGETAPDRRMRADLRAALEAFGGPRAPALWTAVRPHLHAARRRLNQADGYGVFSVTAPPSRFIRTGAPTTPPGALALLTTDGLMRLVDLFEVHDLDSLFDAAVRDGLASLGEAVRAQEAADPLGRTAPRVKHEDDLGALLLSFEG